MDDITRTKLRETLLTYPNITNDNVEDHLFAYEEREKVKQSLIIERGMTNSQAESFLDKQGYPRPPGWGSVINYPGSSQIRWFWLFCFIIISIALGAWLF